MSTKFTLKGVRTPNTSFDEGEWYIHQRYLERPTPDPSMVFLVTQHGTITYMDGSVATPDGKQVADYIRVDVELVISKGT